MPSLPGMTTTTDTPRREYVDGATAIVRGAIDAGCTFFAGYPITPASGILMAMMRELPKVGGVAMQGEDEIASIGMCLGATMTGARAMTATSGPGISLYSENIGMAIMGEVPLVIVDVQRLGPATGGATTVAQGDVQFVRWGTAGGYPVIVLAPSSVPEAYSLTVKAFELAERFRCPVFLLTDKEIAMTLSAVDVDRRERHCDLLVGEEEHRTAEPLGEFERLDRQRVRLGDTGGREHDHRVASGGPPPGELHITLSNGGGAACRRSEALDIDDDERDLAHDRHADVLRIQADPGTGGCGHRPRTGHGRSEAHADRSDLVLALHRDTPDLREFTHHRHQDPGGRGDRVAGEERTTGVDCTAHDRGRPIHVFAPWCIGSRGHTRQARHRAYGSGHVARAWMSARPTRRHVRRGRPRGQSCEFASDSAVISATMSALASVVTSPS